MHLVEVYASEWVREKLSAKHRVEIEEVKELLLDAGRRVFRARDGSYLALGRTAAGRYLAVFFFTTPVSGGVRARVATARDMDDAERRRYDRK